jgi:MazG family protein
MPTPRATAFERLLQLIDSLREPDGCPWDLKQTVQSMASCVIEEGYELVEAIEQNDDGATCDELGDLLMVLALICRIASEEGRFDMEQAAERVADKIVRRHPHVFGDRAKAKDSDEALASWESVKAEERAGKVEDQSALAGLPIALPALARAARTCEKAIGSGFRWKNPAGALAKVSEELAELRQALEPVDLEAGAKVRLAGKQRERVEEELGDLLMATAFFGRYIGLDPERACRGALRRFEGRFRDMEASLGVRIADCDLETLMEAWEAAKAREACPLDPQKRPI